MKCVICGSQDIKEKNVDEEIKLENDLVMVNVNVLVCSSCGERYYDKKAMNKIEETRSRLQKRDLAMDEVGKVFKQHVA